VKFVDRTFNADLARAKHIVRFILANNISTNFHIELCLDACDDEFVELLKSAPLGFFQIEAGLQSVNKLTLSAVGRKTDFQAFRNTLLELGNNDNIRLHTDLIAMLPEETIDSFYKGFDFLFYMRPHIIQLGFLKVLKGTKLYSDVEKYKLVVSNHPPFEVLSTSTMNHEDFITLKHLEHLTEKYYNSGGFSKTLTDMVYSKSYAPHEFFLRLIGYFKKNRLFDGAYSQKDMYRFLYEFLLECGYEDMSYLAYDYIKNVSFVLPNYLRSYAQGMSKEDTFEFIKANRDLINTFESLSALSAKEVFKKVAIYRFMDKVDSYDSLLDGNLILFVDEFEETVKKQRKHMVVQDSLIL
jgi:hypothetical protein